MDVWLVKTRSVLNRFGKGRVVFLCKHVFHKRRISESVHDPGVEVTSQTISLGVIEHEVGCFERSSLHTTTASAAGDVQWVLLCSWFNVVTIPTKTCVGVEDGGLQDVGGIWILRFCVLRPVPVPVSKSVFKPFIERVVNIRLATSVSAIVVQCRLIGGDEVAVPEDEESNPVNSRCLAAMNCLMVVEAIQSVLDTRRCIFLRQT